MICKYGKILILAIAITFSCNNAFSEETKRVVILPFETHSKTDALQLQNQMTASLTNELLKTEFIRIVAKEQYEDLITGKMIDDELAIDVGRDTDSDFVITGSLTRIGNLLSADVRVMDVIGKEFSRGIYAQGMGIENIGELASKLAEEILLKTLSDQKITKVEFTGNERVGTSAIYDILTNTKGKLFSRDKLSDDIKAIYKMGYFRDVRAGVTDSPEGKVIVFTLQEMPMIRAIEITGNDDIDRDDIEKELSIEPKQLLNLDKVKSDVENIRKLYKKEGYLNAEVTHKIEESDKSAAVIFNIKENRRVYIKTISFEGNKAYTADELRDMMDVSEWGIFHFLTDSGLLDEEKLKQSIDKLTAFYHNNGYINARIAEPEITYDQKWIYLKIVVTEGKQFKVGAVTITGDVLAVDHSALLEKLRINKKDYFNRESIVKDLDYLTEACNNEGYAYANVSPLTEPKETEQKVNVTYNIDKGNLVYINRISILGNTKTRDKVIRRQIAISEGDLYNRKKLRSSYMRLTQLRYFEEIDFKTGKGSSDELMDVNIEVIEKATGMVSLGAGYSARDGAMVMAQISQQNLFGRGQILNLATSVGSSTTRYELSFIEPWLFDLPLWSKFNVWNMERDYDSYDLDTIGAGVTLGYPIWEKVKGYVGYEYSDDNVTNVASTASKYIKAQEGNITSSGATVSLARDSTDDWMFPSRGSKNRISVEHTGTILQGDTSYTKYNASSSWFFPLPLDNVFGIRGRAGYMNANEGKEIPVFKRFYLGGINSLRGLRDVGPKDEVGDTIGGRTMVCFNAEVLFPFIKDAGIKGVVFYDTGNVWENGYHLEDMRQTAGVGVRWYSPIGPLRLEWGHVLDRKDDESASRWEFTIGMFM
ncbi:MAG: outer membrane protein assembly factor BamA [Deltaproteobacteria bacterium]|nr:outer membrane protein assembly factor BamA [Deltaproteobacteria bacterium]